MIKYLLNEEINKELESIVKPKLYAGITYPFNSLSDRIFEILLYQIYREKIMHNDADIKDRFDYVDLMQGVGEKGRDCILTKNGKHVGLIQCKRVSNNISKPTFIKELLKFLMNSVIEKSLIDEPENFTYFFAVSTGLAGTTKELIRDFNNAIILDREIENYFNQLKNEYTSLKKLDYKSSKDEILFKLKKIRVERILPQDIEFWLINMIQVQRAFFEVKTVTDNSLIDKIEKKYLKPILKLVDGKNEKKKSEFSLNFKEYLERSYLYYSSARTLVFGNQQKRLEDFYYPLELTIKNRNLIIKTKEYPDELLPKYKKVILVDSGGMGKSTIMKWMFTCAIRQNKGIPIFIELRLLSEKNPLINEIIFQISPIDKPVSKDLMLSLIKEGNFIFFFDGYDEIKISEKEAVTKNISTFISKAPNNEFIITSRPENEEGIFGDFQTFQIKPLTLTDSYKLIEKLGDYNLRSKALINKLQQTDFKSVKEFLKNPLLISLLYKKFEYRESIPLHKQEFYTEVFEALYKAHDLTKGADYYIRPKESNLSYTEFGKVLRALGFRSIQDSDLEYNKSVLLKLLDNLKEDLPNIKYNSEAFLNDLVLSVPLFQKEGLIYRWAHKSIQEYFAAEFICMDTKTEQGKILLAIFNGERLSNLMHVLNLCYDIDYKSFRNSILYEIASDFKSYCDNSFTAIINDKQIAIDEIRDRQFRTYIEDSYLFRSEQHFKTAKTLRTYFGKIIAKVKVMDRVTADNYYVGIVKKRLNVRSILTLLIEKRNPLIKDITVKDLKYQEQKEGAINKSSINLFDNIVTSELIFIDDNFESPVNNSKHFSKVSIFLKTAYFDYNECLKLIDSVEKENQRLSLGKNYTSGF